MMTILTIVAIILFTFIIKTTVNDITSKIERAKVSREVKREWKNKTGVYSYLKK